MQQCSRMRTAPISAATAQPSRSAPLVPLLCPPKKVKVPNEPTISLKTNNRPGNPDPKPTDFGPESTQIHRIEMAKPNHALSSFQCDILQISALATPLEVP
jgi:hypothetical protein